MKKIGVVVGAASALLAFSAWAGATSDLLKTRAAKGTPVEPGVWHAGLEETRAWAVKEGRPLIAVWSNGESCSHCVSFENNVNSPVFREWMKTSGIVFMFAYSGDPGKDGSSNSDKGQSASTGEWCRDSKLTTFPFVRFYWVDKKGKVLVDKAVIGDKLTKNKGYLAVEKNDPENFIFPGDKGTYNQGGRYGIYYITNGVDGVLRDWTDKPAYQGGAFVTTNTVNACLQALSTTTSLLVPMTREGGDACSQKLRVKGKETKELTVTWKAGQTEQLFSIGSFGATYYQSGANVTLELLDDEGAVQDTTIVACLAAEPANSSTNPYWLKEKTATTLGFGEWTMDLNVLTNKVIAFNKANKGVKRAYSMVLIGGSRWCPDCVAADAYLFDRKEFTDWAKANNVALGVVDVPNYNSVEKGPSLLSYEPSVTSDRFVTRNNSQPADEKLRVMSGAGYLSRKGVAANDAAAVIERNRFLVGTSTAAGGWKNPGAAYAAKKRTGVPQLLVLRDDGTVAARFNTFSNFGPQAWNAAYLTRLSELLAQVDAAEEENNDYANSTKSKVSTRGTVESSLAHADIADYYRIPADAKGQLLGFQLEGASAAVVDFAVVEVNGTTETAVVQTNAAISAGALLTVSIPSVNCYVKLSLPSDGYGNPKGLFACTSGKSTVAAYRLLSNIVLEPQEAEHTWTVPDSNMSVMISARKGVTYRMEGLDLQDTATRLAFVSVDEQQRLYECRADTGIVGIRLSAKKFVYQIWKTGEVGFTQRRATVSEKSGSYAFVVKRVGGAAGIAAATISLDASRSTKQAGIWDSAAWFAEYEGKELTWAEGETAREYSFRIKLIDNDFADDAQQLVFKLTKSGGYAPVGGDSLSEELVVTITNDDKPTPGKIGVTGCDAGFAKNMSVVAKGGSTLEFEVMRYGGADGSAAVKMIGTRCELSDTSFAWAARESGEAFKKTLSVKLPAYSAQNKTAAVKLASASGAKVDSLKRTVSITIVPENAPEFSRAAGETGVYRYVTLPADLGVEVIGDGSLSVKKYSGSLPAGVAWKFDKASKRLVFSGAPSKVGTFVAAFRAYRGSVAGGVYQITFNVSDPTAPSPDPTVPYNPNVAVSRTISDIRDIDDRGGDGSSLYGLMTLTINRSGKLSAKNRTIEGTYSFASKGWSEVADDGTLVAKLVCVSKSSPSYGEASLTVTVPADDQPIKIESAMGFAEIPLTWSQVGANPADWAGYYTVNLHDIEAVKPIEGEPVEALCSGDGYMTLKMTSSLAKKQGKMTYAALLPNGKGVSGTAAISPSMTGSVCTHAFMPMLVTSSADDLTAVLQIVRKAGEIRKQDRCSVHSYLQPYWHHRESGHDEVSYETLFNAYGTIYDGNDADDFIACCEEKFKTTRLVFFVDTEGLWSEQGGSAAVWRTNDVSITVSKDKSEHPTIVLDNPKNAAGLSFTFARDTGLVNGSFKVLFEDGKKRTLTYKGVVLPGFGTAACSECGLLNSDSLKAPFIGGSAWFGDSFSYEDVRGRVRSKSVKRGCAVSVGLELGK